MARWLAKGPPRTTAVQEGLAALLEMFTFRTYPRRARRLNDRVLAVDKAEDGASFLDVFDWFRTEGYEEAECFNNTRRVFRGGVLEGGAPFTKDACSWVVSELTIALGVDPSALAQATLPDTVPYSQAADDFGADLGMSIGPFANQLVRPARTSKQRVAGSNPAGIANSRGTLHNRALSCAHDWAHETRL